MAACELIIFDCDGTLMDTEMLAAEVEVELLNEYGAELTAKEFAHRFAGTSSEFAKVTMQEELGRSLPDDHFEKLALRMHEKMWREAKTVDGAHEMLDLLDQPRCICSNAGIEKLKIELTRGELWDRFRPYIYSAQDIEGIDQKPAPDLFLHAAKEFETAPENCIVVEDSVAGVTAGKSAGMRVIGFVGGSHTHPAHADQLTDAGAETVIKRLIDVPSVVEAFGLWGGLDA